MLATPVPSSSGGSMAIGSAVTGGTASDVLFVGAGGLLAQDSNFVWDATNHRLGLGVTPTVRLDVKNASGQLARFTDGTGDIGIYVTGTGNQSIRPTTGSLFLGSGGANWFSIINGGFIGLGNIAGVSISGFCVSVSPNVATNGCIALRSGGASGGPFLRCETSGGVFLSGINADGTFNMPTLADGSAANSSLYFSSTSSGLAYKSSTGAVDGLALKAPLASPTFTGTVTVPALDNAVHYGPITSDTDGATITFDMSVSDWHAVTLGGNRTLAVAGVTVGQQFSLILEQDATGSRTVTWFSGIRWAGGSAPTLTTTASKWDIFTFKCVSAGVYLGFVAGQGA